MKNLFLSVCTLLCFGIASAQEVPQKTKESKTKTDTTYNKKGKHSKAKSTNPKKGDTMGGKRQNQNSDPVRNTTTPQKRDSVNTTTKP